ncbi:MAG: hypothetical protein GXO89_10655 [Chlorobi bacterium]|nr:hypothetical protein [Chlorobiota bacterium]
MKKHYALLLLVVWMPFQKEASAQETNPDTLLLRVKQKLEIIKDYKADMEIHLDVGFIKMPDKHAKMYFKEPNKVRFTSDEFIMLPKRGVGISTRKILRGAYLAVYSGKEDINGKENVMIKVIPEGNKSDIVLSTLWIDPENALVNKMENTTRDNGSYLIHLKYADPEVDLPTEIKIAFRVKDMKIPLRFLGRNSSVDKDELKKDGPKEGIVTVKLKYFDINKGIEDSFFEEEGDSEE